MEYEFNFFQNWYPLSPIEDLDPTRPTSVTLLGMRLVIWKPLSSDRYRVFLDRCPHRLAPLSEGRIDDKTENLMCSYHGWQFDREGICTSIPQAENPKLIAKETNNLCAIAFPSRQEQELLWVWADADSAELAANTPLPLSPQIDASKGFVWSSIVRDLEYDWHTLVENVADPSHVAFAHHGIQGNREKATSLPFEIVKSLPNLIEAKVMGTSITFKPPCLLEYKISFKEEKQLGLVTYCLPVSPGKSRIVAQFPRNFAKTVFRLVPRWWEHINTRNAVLDGDMILLRQQEYIVRQQHQNWKTAYKMPTTADRLVIEFRKWFDRYCGGQLPWSEVGITPTNLNVDESREVVLDRYSQHTQHCSSCRGALKNIKRLQWMFLSYFVVTVSVVTVMSDRLRVSAGLPLMVVALLGMGVYAWLKFWLEPKFHFIDYIHAER
jgi:phenylpropionate dioxygenase-like ring-hydroxylating dioxygenase large terminal subunit